MNAIQPMKEPITAKQARKAGLTMPITSAVHVVNAMLHAGVLADASALGRRAALVLISPRMVEVWAEPVKKLPLACRQYGDTGLRLAVNPYQRRFEA